MPGSTRSKRLPQIRGDLLFAAGLITCGHVIRGDSARSNATTTIVFARETRVQHSAGVTRVACRLPLPPTTR